MIYLQFRFKLFPKPRGNLAYTRSKNPVKNGKAYIYHSTAGYIQFKKDVKSALDTQLGRYQTIEDRFYIGLFSAYNPPKNGRYPDLLDNELGGLLDAFVQYKFIKDDSRKYAIGDKILSYPYSTDINYVFIGSLLEMTEIDENVNSLYYKAMANLL